MLAALAATAAQLAADGPAAGLRALPAGAAVALLGWVVFARPRVDVDDTGVLVVNPFTTTHVPWGALIEVRTRYTCTFVTPHRRVEAFAAPGPGRHVAASATAADLRGVGPGAADGRGSVQIGEVPGSSSATVATYVRRRWNDLAEDGLLDLGQAEQTPVRREVDVRALAALGVLVLLAVAAQLV
ncbi:hypothetical protein Cph01nite_21660 [Cellulomonas phragmiteti]|uniref:Low molecular weight protein antigen 6 PH domain-containing protein n=1 Tax=Cellulomonas phragmiteti TaxID=478780 RepID=A0ABQ4DM33_9CELL|nr:hypothetical protein Cph01nite_21660 [Cellulomonas phragmiteti]